MTLLDLAYKEPVTWWVVFRDSFRRTMLEYALRPGFRHVELWRLDDAWIRVDPCLEYIEVTLHSVPPWEFFSEQSNPTILKVLSCVNYGRVRAPFFVGPITCVELTKSVLGVKTPFLCRTPYQLYKYFKRFGSTDVV